MEFKLHREDTAFNAPQKSVKEVEYKAVINIAKGKGKLLCAKELGITSVAFGIDNGKLKLATNGDEGYFMKVDKHKNFRAKLYLVTLYKELGITKENKALVENIIVSIDKDSVVDNIYSIELSTTAKEGNISDIAAEEVQAVEEEKLDSIIETKKVELDTLVPETNEEKEIF